MRCLGWALWGSIFIFPAVVVASVWPMKAPQPVMLGQPVLKKAERIEVQSGLALQLNAIFQHRYIWTTHVLWHSSQSLAIGLRAGYEHGFSVQPQIRGGVIKHLPAQQHDIQSVQLTMQWAPVYGKLRVMGDTVAYFDAYAAFSAGLLTPGFATFAPLLSLTVGQRFSVGSDWTVMWHLTQRFVPWWPRSMSARWMQQRWSVALGLGLSHWLG